MYDIPPYPLVGSPNPSNYNLPPKFYLDYIKFEVKPQDVNYNSSNMSYPIAF
jgi:hypothetical protein